MPASLSNLHERLRSSKSLVVLTGAGISAESGVPTFRDAQTGLWARYSPEDLATPQAFQRNPRVVWEWYRWRRQLVMEAEPSSGHVALVGLERKVDSFCLITQNVDGLHQRAGSKRTLELHGNLFVDLCAREGARVSIDPDDMEAPPRCPQCGGPVRPGVVWFGESLPVGALEQASEACRTADLVLVVGTSGMVHPAASLPALAKSSGAFVVEINPDPTPLSESMDLSLREKAGPALTSLLEQLS